MRLAAVLVASSLAVAACGSSAEVTSRPASRDLDRTDVVATAEALVTSAIELDFMTLSTLVMPEEQHVIEDMKAAQKLNGKASIEDVEVTANLVEQSGDTATIDYKGSYCVDAQSHETTVTTAGQVEESGSAPGESVKEPRQCFDLGDVFRTHGVQYRRIDGKWYGPLPA